MRLEQGRATTPSTAILTALFRALRLSASEREHLCSPGGPGAAAVGADLGPSPAGRGAAAKVRLLAVVGTQDMAEPADRLT